MCEIEEAFKNSVRQIEEQTRERNRLNEASAQKRQEKSRLGQHQSDLQTAKVALKRKQGQLQETQQERQEFLRERSSLQKKIEVMSLEIESVAFYTLHRLNDLKVEVLRGHVPCARRACHAIIEETRERKCPLTFNPSYHLTFNQSCVVTFS